MAETITLYGFGEALGLPDLSPFCTKLETYLRLAGLSFEKKAGNPQKAPRGKMPYLRKGKELLGDSSLIIAQLEQESETPLDAGLTDRQRAEARALQSMMEEHLYFVILYLRWQDEVGWRFYKGEIKSMIQRAGAPGLVASMLPPFLRRGVIKSLKGQGVGRFDKAQVEALGIELIDALAAYLGDQPYFLGEAPRTLDATAYAFLSGFLVPYSNAVEAHLRTHDNLMAYCQRIKAQAYSEATSAS